MSMIGKISWIAAEQNLPFIVIGGHAVMAHGFVRATSDWDLLISKEQIPGWRLAMENLGFKLQFSGPTFLQFHPLPGEIASLDLILVDGKNFRRMQADAEWVEADGVTVKVVSIPHLFALKCHAFQNNPHRAMKDIEDLVQLTRIKKLDLNEPGLRAMLLKHGGTEFYELLKRECGKSGVA
jgi:hypothetical protein